MEQKRTRHNTGGRPGQRIDRRGSLIGGLVLAESDEVLMLKEKIAELQTALEDKSVLNKESILNNLANAFMKCDRIMDAIKHYRAALELNKEDAAVYMNLGVAYKHMDMFDKALVNFEKSLKIRPTADEHYNMANTYLKLSPPNYDSAIEHYKEALRMDPNHLNCHQNLGLALKTIGKIDAAIMEMRTAVKLGEGTDTNSFYNLGNALVSKGGQEEGGGAAYLEEAVSLYREATVLAPGDADIRTNLAITLSHLGRFEEAVTEYFDVMKLQPGDSMTHFNCGNALLEAQNIQGAIEQFRKSLDLDPEFLDGKHNLGMALMEAGKLEEATRMLEAYLGDLDEREDQDEDDGEEMTESKALQVIEDKALIYYNLGTMYSKRGMPTESKEALEFSIELKEENSLAHLNLGNQEISLGNIEAGFAQFELAVMYSPDDPSVLRNLAYVMIEQGKLQEGAEKLRMCLEMNPDDIEIKSYLDQIEEKLAVKDKISADIKALEEKVSGAEGGGSFKDKAGLAMAYRANNEFAKAIEQLEQCLVLQPLHPQIPGLLSVIKSQAAETIAELTADTGKEKLKDEELVHATGRFSIFAGKKKGRGKKKKKSGKVAIIS
ncbi:hypothetical protein TrVE_jg10603 [Triparma verrucosa]|uniref:Uncharacterized protein n=1 Tax=Triparma verrucosa TaxID=1606542 RepID=A0A9W7CDC6_9STRA|nr:hypothetical protein TrVE_jg10603 [Triparma verrucosa]